MKTPISHETKQEIRNIIQEGYLTLYGLVAKIRAEKWAWPTKQVTDKQVQDFLTAEKCYEAPDGIWHLHPPTQQERADAFVAELESDKRTGWCGCRWDCSCMIRQEAHNDALDDVITLFRRKFPEFFPETKG